MLIISIYDVLPTLLNMLNFFLLNLTGISIVSGRRKIHFTLTDGRELAEEYDLRTNELIGNISITSFIRSSSKRVIFK